MGTFLGPSIYLYIINMHRIVFKVCFAPVVCHR